MRVRAPRTLVALALAGGVLLAGGTAAVAAPVTGTAATAAHTAPVPVAKRPVSRFVAWQACSAAMWHWVAENAAIGSAVDTHFNGYRSSLEWRDSGGWYVQIAGKAHERATANNGSSHCLVKGTNAHPRIAGYTYPR
jgi:hypothetical protein